MIQGVNPSVRSAVSTATNDDTRSKQSVHTSAQDAVVDSLELSEATRKQLDAGGDTLVRNELVQRVRTEIADGSYLTNDKLDSVVDRLVGELFGGN